jgi:FixJ family two-component response regulator
MPRPNVLVVDDDPAVAGALQDVLQEEFEVRALTSAPAAMEELKRHEVAVLLADQRMPVMDGVELLSEARRLQPALVGVLMTAHADLETAIDAINQARVLAFLTKPWDEQELLETVRRAIQAHLALRHLSDRSQAPERELRLFQQITDAAPVPVTARRFGAGPLRQAAAAEFDQLAQRYANLLALALEQRVYKVDHRVSVALREVADQLGMLDAGPRDVLDLHLHALRARLASAPVAELPALTEEGRLLVLELMGDLVTYYRNVSLGARR